MVFGARRLGTVMLLVFLLTVDAVPVAEPVNSNNIIQAGPLRAAFLHETAKFLHEIHQNGLFAGVKTMAFESHAQLRATNRTARAARNSNPSVNKNPDASQMIFGGLATLGGAVATVVLVQQMLREKEAKTKSQASTFTQQQPTRLSSLKLPFDTLKSPRLENLKQHLSIALPDPVQTVANDSWNLRQDCETLAEDYVLLACDLQSNEDPANIKSQLQQELFDNSGCELNRAPLDANIGIKDLRKWKQERVHQVYENYRTVMSNFQQFPRLKTSSKSALFSIQIIASLAAIALGISGSVKTEKLGMIGLSVLELLMFMAMEMPLETDQALVQKPSGSSVTNVLQRLHNCLPTDTTIDCEACDAVMSKHCGKENAEWARIRKNAGCLSAQTSVRSESTGNSWTKVRENSRKLVKKVKRAGQSVGSLASKIISRQRLPEDSKSSDRAQATVLFAKNLEVTTPEGTELEDGDQKNQVVASSSTELPVLPQIVKDAQKSPKQAPKPVDARVRVAVQSLTAHCYVSHHIDNSKITMVRLGLACLLLCLFAVYAGLSIESTGVRSGDITVTHWTYIGLVFAVLSLLCCAGFVIAIMYFHFQQKMIATSEVVEVIVKLCISVVELLPFISLWRVSDYFNPSWVANKGHLWSLSLVIQILLFFSHAIPFVGSLRKLSEKHDLAHVLTNSLVGNDLEGCVEKAFPKTKDDNNRLRILAGLITTAFGWNRKKGVPIYEWKQQNNVELGKAEIKLPEGGWDFLSLCFVYKRDETFRFATPLAPTELPPTVTEFCKLNEWTAAKYFSELEAAIKAGNQDDEREIPIFTWEEFKENNVKVQQARAGIRRSDAQLGKLYDSNCVLRPADQPAQQPSEDGCSIEKLTHKFLLFADDPKTKVRTTMHGGIEFASLLGNFAVMFGMSELLHTDHQSSNSTTAAQNGTNGLF